MVVAEVIGMAAPVPGPGGNTGSGGVDVSSGPLSPLHPASPIAKGAQASEQQCRERCHGTSCHWRFFRSLGCTGRKAACRSAVSRCQRFVPGMQNAQPSAADDGTSALATPKLPPCDCMWVAAAADV